MKLTKITLAALVGVAAGVVSLGAGIGIGTAIPGSSSSTTENMKNNAIARLFSTPRAPAPTVNQPKIVDYNKTNGFPVALVSDGAGLINDKSFNEESGDGVLDIYGYLSGPKGSISNRTDLYRLPTSTDASNVVAAYTQMATDLKPPTNGKKVIVAPGFAHFSAIKRFWEKAGTDNKYDNLYFLLLDNPAIQGKDSLKHTFSIEFDVSKIGFKTGYLSALYLEAINDQTPKVGLWGGGAFPAVLSFMKGYVSGVKYYNDHKVESAPKVEIVKFNKDEEFTNSGFEAGGGRSKADFLITKGADVILPVAGAQTKDLITAINASDRKDEVKIIGVDNDQSITYSESKNLFLSSITKNLRKAAYEGYKVIAKGNSSAIHNITYPASDGSTTVTFIGSDADGFTSYVKQFDTTKDTLQSRMWKAIYDQVDSVTPTVMTWDDSLAYIKK